MKVKCENCNTGGWMKKRSLQYWGKEEPICPYCDHVEQDCWEQIPNPMSEETQEINCGSCGKDYFCDPCVSVTYTTYGDCEIHQLEKDYEAGGAVLYICQTCAVEVYDWDLEGGKYEKFKKHQYQILNAEVQDEQS